MIKSLKKNIINIPGWNTSRKIVVIESDDWGMIRMKSKDTFNYFLNKGYDVDKCPYNRYDSLECNDDLELLFEVLSSVKDKSGNPAVFTLNNIVANPDFEKIKKSEFQEYYYEPFTVTLQRYPGRERVLELYREGKERKIISPQFHGREHLNVNRWMEGLNQGNRVLLEAFENEMFTVHKSGTINGRRDNLDAFGMAYGSEWTSMKEVIQTGLDLFESIWGFRARSFIAPCYIWRSEIENTLYKQGITSLQGTYVQRIPADGRELKVKRKYHYQGQQNDFGQRYLVRNAFFEPAEYEEEDPVNRVLNEIKTAFRYNKPAVISSHRVNYIGSIRPENRDKNLLLLKGLLNEIISKFPEVEFMSSEQLCRLMNKGD